MTFADWNLFDDTEAWRDVTLGTKEERKAKMQDRQASPPQGGMDSGIRPTTVVPGSVGSLIVQATNTTTDIGAERAFPRLPARVEVGGASYFLIKTRDGYRLLSRRSTAHWAAARRQRHAKPGWQRAWAWIAA